MSETSTPRQGVSLWQLLVSLSVVITLIGAVFFVWNLFFSRPLASFVYSTPSPVTIFESGPASTFSVIGADGKKITDNIYLQEVIVWNAGKQPIEPDLIRIPITIGLASSTATSTNDERSIRILESKVARQTQPTVIKASVRNNGVPARSVKLMWEHLDPGQAATVQIIYTTTADDALEMRVDGQIVGIPRFFDSQTPPIERLVLWLPGWTLFISLFAVPLLLFLFIIWMSDKLDIQNPTRFSFFVTIAP